MGAVEGTAATKNNFMEIGSNIFIEMIKYGANIDVVDWNKSCQHDVQSLIMCDQIQNLKSNQFKCFLLNVG